MPSPPALQLFACALAAGLLAGRNVGNGVLCLSAGCGRPPALRSFLLRRGEAGEACHARVSGVGVSGASGLGPSGLSAAPFACASKGSGTGRDGTGLDGMGAHGRTLGVKLGVLGPGWLGRRRPAVASAPGAAREAREAREAPGLA